jgi:hypothetical protein
MKVRKEHIDYMKTAIDAYAIQHGGIVAIAAVYERGEFPLSEKVRDLQKRFCFDIMNSAGLTDFVCDNIYPYADDTHVLTALRSILPTVERKY